MTPVDLQAYIDTLEKYGETYSNYDHEMPRSAENVLRTKQVYITHAAWDH